MTKLTTVIDPSYSMIHEKALYDIGILSNDKGCARLPGFLLSFNFSNLSAISMSSFFILGG